MSKEDRYRALARIYKISPAVAADMTPLQQMILLDEDAGSDTASFATLEEYLEWKHG
jgi:hypothetical protein